MEESKEKVVMPENEAVREEEQKVEKLNYEQLEGVAKQMSAQIDYLAKENQQLKMAVQQLQRSNMYTELDFKFKVLKFANFFKPAFVEDIVKSIEETMTPEEQEEEEK